GRPPRAGGDDSIADRPARAARRSGADRLWAVGGIHDRAHGRRVSPGLRPRERMKPTIAFFGSSLVSAYWNGAATYYRGIIHALAERGDEITFYEPDAYAR